MSQRPFFSVVIPTRGRPQLLDECVRSVLAQDFQDYELIVSDNWNEQETVQVIGRFAGEARVRSIRTDRLLSMPEHWHFATSEARGQYVMLLSDRMLMRPSALSVVHEALQRFGQPDVALWSSQTFDELSGTFDPHGLDGGIDFVESTRILRDVAENNRAEWWRLPRLTNSCIRVEWLRSLQNRWGSLFKPVSPDFTSAFMTLASTPRVLSIARPLYVSRGLAFSTGLNNQRGRPTGYMASLGEIDPSRFVPIKTFLVWNSVFSDFEATKALMGNAFPVIELHLGRYFASCLEEIELIERTDPQSDLREARAEWERARREFRVTWTEVDRARQSPRTWKAKVRDHITKQAWAQPARRAYRRIAAELRRWRAPSYLSAFDATRKTDAEARAGVSWP